MSHNSSRLLIGDTIIRYSSDNLVRLARSVTPDADLVALAYRQQNEILLHLAWSFQFEVDSRAAHPEAAEESANALWRVDYSNIVSLGAYYLLCLLLLG